MTNVKMIEEKAKEFNYDLLEVKKELKRLQSLKCRLLKQKGLKDYEQRLESILKDEQVMKEVRSLIDPKEKTVTTFEQEDVDNLDYNQVLNAIESIRSKKSLTRWLTPIDGDNDEFRNACRIEQMLLERKKMLKPVEDNLVRKTELVKIIDTIENTSDISTERILEMLKNLI